MKSAFLDLRLHLAFLPVIGHWFAPDADTRDEDDGKIEAFSERDSGEYMTAGLMPPKQKSE